MTNPIVNQTPETITEPQAKFNATAFNQVLFDKGIEVVLDRALKCPCINPTSNSPLGDCKNCNGVGWLFITPLKTRMVIQGIGSKKDYQLWTEDNKGMVRISSRAIDQVGWMDRITIIDADVIFNEVVYPRLSKDNKLYFLPIYAPIEILDIFAFKSASEELVRLTTSQYQIVDNKVILDDSFKNKQKFRLTVRYSHHPTYHIVDPMREIFVTRANNGQCKSDDELTNLPQYSMARRAHYIFDKLNYEQDNLLYNS